MTRITGELDLGRIPDEQCNSELDLRVAVLRPLCPGVCVERKAAIA